MMASARQFIDRDIHPTIIVSTYYYTIAEELKIMKDVAVLIDFNINEEVQNAILCCIGTKFAARWKILDVEWQSKVSELFIKD